jgi:hypothetical protein
MTMPSQEIQSPTDKAPHFEVETVAALHALLDELATRYETARQTLTAKRDMLIGNQSQAVKNGALQEADRELLSISNRVSQLDAGWRQMQAQMHCADWKLSAVIQAVSESTAVAHFTPKLMRVRERLERALQDTTRLNLEIHGLLELSLGWMRETVEIITSAVAPEGASYTAMGGKNRSPERASAPPSLSSTISHSA